MVVSLRSAMDWNFESLPVITALRDFESPSPEVNSEWLVVPVERRSDIAPNELVRVGTLCDAGDERVGQCAATYTQLVISIGWKGREPTWRRRSRRWSSAR